MTSFDTYDKPTLDTKFAGKVGSFDAVGGVTPTVENGVADLSSLFTSANTSLKNTISQLANVADAQIQTDGKLLITYQDGTKKTFAGGTEIKKDDDGNYYYDVED